MSKIIFTAKDGYFMVKKGKKVLYQGSDIELASKAVHTKKSVIPSKSDMRMATMERIIEDVKRRNNG